MNISQTSLVYIRYISGKNQLYLRQLSDIAPPAPSIMLSQPKKTYRHMARRKYNGTSDLMAKARLKDENDNLSASIDKIHRTRERKFQFTYNKLHEVLNKLEEKGAVCELVSSIKNKVSDNNSLVNDTKRHPMCS